MYDRPRRRTVCIQWESDKGKAAGIPDDPDKGKAAGIPVDSDKGKEHVSQMILTRVRQHIS